MVCELYVNITVKEKQTNNNQIHWKIVFNDFKTLKSFEHLLQIPEGLPS